MPKITMIAYPLKKGTFTVDLPDPVLEFFERLDVTPGYGRQTTLERAMILHGIQIGGYHINDSYWYLFEGFIRDFGASPSVIEAHGFEHIVRPNKKHDLWVLRDMNAVDSVEKAITALTRVPILLSLP